MSVRLTVRGIPAELHAAIVTEAERQMRSLNDQILLTLMRAYRYEAPVVKRAESAPISEDVADLADALKRSLGKRTVRAKKGGAR